MPNYGDIRLNLPPDWDRRNVENSQFINSTIGHRNGVAEVRFKEDPERRYAFAWADPREVNGQCDVDQNLDEGYAFVKKDEWIAERWKWDAENRLRCEGQLLMFMTEPVYTALEAKRAKRIVRPQNPIDDSVYELANELKSEIVTEEPRRQLGRRG